MAKILLAAFCSFLFYITSLSAQDIDKIKFLEGNWNSDVFATLDDKPIFLPANLEFDVTPPPTNSSSETQGELNYLKELSQNNRDEETLERIYYENTNIPIMDIFVKEGLVLSDDIDTWAFLEMVDHEVKYYVVKYKKHFMRPRPSQLVDDLKLAIENPGHPAYPSGHATQTYAIASILADFDTNNADNYYQFARDVAHRREIAGVHYPSDSKVGQMLAPQIIEKLRENAEFEELYQIAKKNFKKPEKMGGQTPVK